MKIEWWMLDGLIGLIMLICIIRGIAKGIGDTVLRLLGIAGGLTLGVFYSDKVSEFLNGTKLRVTLHNNIYELIRPGIEQAAAEQTTDPGAGVIQMVEPTVKDDTNSPLPKVISGMINGIADRSAEAAADKLTEMAVDVLGFVLILLAIWLLMVFIRLIYRMLRKESVVIGFFDRVFGMVLGIVRGTVISCIAMAALVPVATIIAPERVMDIMDAMDHTYVAGIIYDINPLLLLINYFIL